MNSGRYWLGGLVMAALLMAPLAGYADTYKREGGKAFHVSNTCPALSGFKVVKVESTAGLVPCRVCCKDMARTMSSGTGGMKLDQPRALSIQDMAGTNKVKEPAEQDYRGGGGYGGGRVFNPVRQAYGSDYVVSNGQILDAYDGEPIDMNYGGDFCGE